MSKTPENKNQTINKTKHGKNQIPDYERLFQDGAEQEHERNLYGREGVALHEEELEVVARVDVSHCGTGD